MWYRNSKLRYVSKQKYKHIYSKQWFKKWSAQYYYSYYLLMLHELCDLCLYCVVSEISKKQLSIIRNRIGPFWAFVGTLSKSGLVAESGCCVTLRGEQEEHACGCESVLYLDLVLTVLVWHSGRQHTHIAPTLVPAFDISL